MRIHCSSNFCPRARACVRAACLAGLACGILLPGTASSADHAPAAGPAVRATWVGTPAEHATPAALKSIYLECDRMSMTTVLDFGTASSCSIVYEALKARVFGGDFGRLLEWSREQQRAHAPAPTAAQRRP